MSCRNAEQVSRVNEIIGAVFSCLCWPVREASRTRPCFIRRDWSPQRVGPSLAPRSLPARTSLRCRPWQGTLNPLKNGLPASDP